MDFERGDDHGIGFDALGRPEETAAPPGTLWGVELTLVKDWSIIAAGLIALVTFFVATLENIRRNRQERAQNLIMMRRRFLETPQYREILDMLQADDPKLREISVQEKRNFVGFLEEIALMVNSRLIRQEVAHYMFGYYVCLTERNEHFWQGLDRQSSYWSVFRHFAAEMARLEGYAQTSPKELAL